MIFMKYQIGLVSKLMDLSAEGLRLYEREGILLPQREGTAGYRFYERLDITSLLRARSYQKYGFSLHEIKQLIHTDDLTFLTRQYRRKEEELEREILLKQLELEHLHSTREEIQQFSQSLWKIKRENRPPMYRLEFMRGEELTLPKEQYDLLQQWAAWTPLAFSSLRHDWQAMKRGEDCCYSAIGVLEKSVTSLGIQELSKQGEYVPECRCLSTIVEVKGEACSCLDYLSHLMEYVDQNQIEVAGDPISQSIVSFNKKKNYTRYRKIWLPILDFT